jgi:phosphohistidine phosphatase SixA
MNQLMKAVLLCCAQMPAHAQSSPATRPAQIILIRHAEKPVDPADPHLSPAGVERARRLVSFIKTDPAMRRFGSPVAVFATQTTKDDNGQRTQETVAPLAAALGVAVQTPFHGKDYAALATRILSNPAYAGKTVVICWNHEEIPQLVAALGVTTEPPKWKGSVFDVVYVIAYRRGSATLSTSRYGTR